MEGTWISLLPPIIAIGLAIALRQAIFPILIGVYCGVFILEAFHPLTAFLRVTDTYLVGALVDIERASILLACLLLAGMVSITTAAGGAAGLSGMIRRFASTPRRAQVGTWILGMALFIDDYINSLILGYTLRPTMDRLGISRQKFAFLVDSTAATIASLALISSWIAAEVSFVAREFTRLGIDQNPLYVVFQSIQYRYYPILMLVFVLVIAVTDKDFGPMLRAERSARALSPPPPAQDTPVEHRVESVKTAAGLRWYYTVTPVLVTIAAMALGMYLDGWAQMKDASALSAQEIGFWQIFGEGRAPIVLLWSSLLGCAIAAFLALSQKTLTFKTTTAAGYHGMQRILPGLIVLILAWSMSDVCLKLRTADFLINAAGAIPPAFIPASVFLVAATASFATGTSWGTMGILFPLVIPTASALGSPEILIEAIASVLAGSVFGDHCSPISDTTILTAIATDCDLMDHVRTQMPYALVVGVVGVVIGDVGVGLDLWPSWAALLLGALILVGLILGIGRRV